MAKRVVTERDAQILRDMRHKLDHVTGPGVVNGPHGLVIAPTGKAPIGADPGSITRLKISKKITGTNGNKWLECELADDLHATAASRTGAVLAATDAKIEVAYEFGNGSPATAVVDFYSVGDVVTAHKIEFGAGVRGSDNIPIAWLLQLPAVFYVTVSQVGGSAGDVSNPCTYTYDVDSPSGNTIATAIDPTSSPHKWNRPSTSGQDAATAGLATWSLDGSDHLQLSVVDINERTIDTGGGGTDIYVKVNASEAAADYLVNQVVGDADTSVDGAYPRGIGGWIDAKVVNSGTNYQIVMEHQGAQSYAVTRELAVINNVDSQPGSLDGGFFEFSTNYYRFDSCGHHLSTLLSGSSWSLVIPAYLYQLADVDSSLYAPTTDYFLAWDGAEWTEYGTTDGVTVDTGNIVQTDPDSESEAHTETVLYQVEYDIGGPAGECLNYKNKTLSFDAWGRLRDGATTTGSWTDVPIAT